MLHARLVAREQGVRPGKVELLRDGEANEVVPHLHDRRRADGEREVRLLDLSRPELVREVACALRVPGEGQCARGWLWAGQDMT